MKYNDPSGHKACSGFDEYDSCISDTDWKPSNWEPNNSGSSSTPLNPLNNLPNIEDTPLQAPTDPGDNNGAFIGSSCTVSTPCLDAWEQPDWWDTDATNPDYYVFSLNGGVVVGLTGNIIVDRYGNIYVGLGVNAGESISMVSASLNAGSFTPLFDDDVPDQGNIDTLISGLSINGQVGAAADGAVNIDLPSMENIAYETGILIPYSIGFSVTYTWLVIEGSFFH